jgi:hypothetical protein
VVRDVDPENCWYDFQMLRRELGRRPDVDPGARVRHFARDDQALVEAERPAIIPWHHRRSAPFRRTRRRGGLDDRAATIARRTAGDEREGDENER